MKGVRIYIIGDRPLFAWVGTAIADVTAATVGVCLFCQSVISGRRRGQGEGERQLRWFQALTGKLY